MINIPNPVVNYLLNFIFKEHSLAYLLVKKDGSLSVWGGNLAKYGVTNLRPGENISQQIFFLEGLLPLEGISLYLPHIKTNYGIYTDIHIFPSEEGDWVLLLGSTWDEQHVSQIQQTANDLSLLKEKIAAEK